MFHINKVQILVIIIFAVSLFFILKINQDNIEYSKGNIDCNTVYQGKNAKVNVVFLPYGYGDEKRFYEDVDSYVNGEFGFKNVEPFKSNFESFSFYDIVSENIKCDVTDNTFICDDLSAKRAAANCPNDYIIVLYDRDAIRDLIVPIRSSAYLNLASINTADHRLVVLHEFAHIYGGLADEYVEEGIDIDIDRFQNCDVKTCPRWSHFTNAGCFEGCGEINFYRSIDNGIMRNYILGREFGIWNEYLLALPLQS